VDSFPRSSSGAREGNGDSPLDPRTVKSGYGISSRKGIVFKGDNGNGSCVAVLENHFSVVRGLDFSLDGETLVSGSRDQVVNFWDTKSFKLKTTLPVYEVRSRCY